MRSCGATTQPSSCATDEFDMLGHQVRCGDHDGVSAAPKKVKDIVAMLRPHNIQVLQSFLGLAVYLIRFVKDFAELRGPLYDLCKLRKTPEAEITDDMWTDRCQRSFMSVKAALASAPVLAFTDFTAPFIILADCSKFRLGGALVQLRQGTCHSIHVQASEQDAARIWGDIKGIVSSSTLRSPMESLPTWPPYNRSDRPQSTTQPQHPSRVRQRKAGTHGC